MKTSFLFSLLFLAVYAVKDSYAEDLVSRDWLIKELSPVINVLMCRKAIENENELISIINTNAFIFCFKNVPTDNYFLTELIIDL